MTSNALDESQAAAVQVMLRSRLALVTGPPGSGKTTTLRAVLGELGSESFLLCAPTGKAARRMAQATGREAHTIHRLLGYDGKGFTRTADNPVDAGVVFVDEASMIDYDLAIALLAGTRFSRLVLIGDANQLPPVGMGRFFGDLVDAPTVLFPVVRLTTQHRAAAHSWVVRNAPLILEGRHPEMMSPDFDHHDVTLKTDVVDSVVTTVMAAPFAGDVVVLAPQYGGACGVDALNAALGPVLNPQGYGPDRPVIKRKGASDDPEDTTTQHLRVGMRVIQTQNNYQLDVMNGEIGHIQGIDPEQQTCVVSFPELESGRLVQYSRKETTALRPAYALTVHKTQGSEFPHVVVVIHSSHTRMLSRGILYTAVTRASQRVTLIGDALGLRRALRTDAAKRNTTLIERLQDRLEPIEVNV